MSGFSLFGVNLSGAEYDPGGTQEGTNYTYPTDAEIDYYASKGMTVIRLPFLLERVEPVAGGPLSATELGYIDNVVNYAASKGIDVILDPHDYGTEYGTVIGTTAASNATFANFWGELAAHFASTPNVLFGLMNEPNAVTPTQWLASANAAIAAIRAAGATTQQILVPGTDWDGADTWVSSGNAQVLGSGIVDPSHNFAFEVHQYLDADGSGTSSTVVSTTIGVERLTAITEWAEATGNKLFLGEFGVASDPTSLTALNNMLGYMALHTDVWEGGTYWAAGPWLGNYMYSVEPTDGVDKPQMAVLEKYVPITLTELGGHFYLNNAAGIGPMLEQGGVAVTAGQYGGWAPFAVERTSSGYEVAWKDAATGQYSVWTTNSNGNYISGSGHLSGSSYALESFEAGFHQDLNGDGTIGLVTTVIQTDGSTSLAEVANVYFLDGASGSSDAELKLGGAAVTVGSISGWTPIGAIQTSSGYEVAWKDAATGQYSVWTTNSNGNYISGSGHLSGSSYALESFEAGFHQDLNGDGTIGLVTTVIQTDGSTSLAEVANVYFLDGASGSSDAELKLGGAAVTVGSISGWTPIGAIQTSSGYEVAWKDAATGQYSVWTTNSNGNYISGSGHLSGSSYALESFEAGFHQDLNGDGTIGLVTTVIQTDGSTSLAEVANVYFLDGASGSSDAELKLGGAAVTVGSISGWTPIGAIQTSSGYEVAWKDAATGQYSVWTTNSNGNYISGSGHLSGSSYALESFEAGFHQDLNGDGVVGIAVAANATLELSGVHSDNVTFEGSTGTLKLDSPSTFTGEIVDFIGDGTLSGSDQVDLPNVSFSNAIQFLSSYAPSAGALTVTDGATVDVLHFMGCYSPANFEFASDAHGGTIVYDPPATTRWTSADASDDAEIQITGDSTTDGAGQVNGRQVIVDSGATLTLNHTTTGGGTITNDGTIEVANKSTVNMAAGAGRDNFVFTPDFGRATISHFAPGTDSVTIDHAIFSSLDALFTETHDFHGSAVITDAAHDTITFENVTTAQLLAHQSDFHLS